MKHPGGADGLGQPRALVAGMAWGFMPCAMVYAALFTAMLTGSAGGAMVTMTAFGLGTLPGLTAASFGFRRLAGITRIGPGRVAAGLAIAVFGIGTVLVSHPGVAYLCLPGHASGSTPAAAPAGASHWHSAPPLDRHQMAREAAALAFVATDNGGAKIARLNP